MKTQLFRIFDIRLSSGIYINIWTIPVAICAFLGGYARLFFLSYAAALAHELAHILTAKVLKVKISRMNIYPFGVCAKLANGYINSSAKELFIAAAGPLLNLAAFWICNALGFFDFADINLLICCVNLTPALPLDGGRIARSLLTARFGMIRAYNFMLKFSRIAIFALAVVACVILIAYEGNFSLLMISAFLLQNLCCEQQAVTMMTLREILSQKNKVENCDAMKVRTICVSPDRAARKIFSVLSYDCFYVIHVTNSEGKIIKTVTETQVLNRLIEKNIRINYADV